jgi:phospholipase/lecithinase/hemolysin
MLKRSLHAIAAGLPALALAAALAAPTMAQAGRYPAVYVFGDSLSDAGNDWIGTQRAEPISPPYSDGRFSNGPVWVQRLTLMFGVKPLKPFLAGGNDYADGGAESGATLVHKLAAIDVPAQIAEFTTDSLLHPPAKGALYVLWVGANDLFDILGHTPALTEAQIAKAIRQVVTNEVEEVVALKALGAENLLMLTSPDLGKVPAVAGLGPLASAAGSIVSAAYNKALVPAVQAESRLLGIKLRIIDAYSAMDAFIADPTKYGFTDVTDPCWTGSYTSATSGKLCSRTLAGQDQYLFWDMVHPTAAGHALIATTVYDAMK